MQAVAFSKIQIPEKHSMTKSQTRLIESFNSSVRDNLVCFNYCIERFSKTFLAPDFSLTLLFTESFSLKQYLFATAPRMRF